jgi:hypothetical protein
MRVLVIVVATLAVAVAAAPAASPKPIALRVVYFEDGREPETKIVRWLRCNPPRGTLPRRTAACRELARLGVSTLLPIPPATACTEIYGGPQVAYVSGVVNGRRVWAKLRRDDGCQIDRWNRNWFLVPT